MLVGEDIRLNPLHYLMNNYLKAKAMGDERFLDKY